MFHAMGKGHQIEGAHMQMCVQIWPGLASWFGLETGLPRQLPLRDFFPAQEALWKQTQKKYSLKDTELEKVG